MVGTRVREKYGAGSIRVRQPEPPFQSLAETGPDNKIAARRDAAADH
jgi:hypothetical protein